MMLKFNFINFIDKYFNITNSIIKMFFEIILKILQSLHINACLKVH